jgi:hypothetical protein
MISTKRSLGLVPALVLLACGGAVDQTGEPTPTVEDPSLSPEARNELAPPPMMGAHWTRDEAGAHSNGSGGGSSRALLSYHRGKIMTTYVAKAIFWGPTWADTDAGPSPFADKVAGMDTFYTGHSGSNYSKTVNEYTDTVGGGHTVGDVGTYQGHIIDPSPATASASGVLAEVCRQIASGQIAWDPNGYYPVYTDVPRGSARFCAWHSYGTCGTALVQFAFFFNLDGDPGCDPQDGSGLHSQGTAALANVSAHELSEARSDPASPGAWYDSQGNENGDKCAWTFNVPLVTFADGTQWKVQGEWSNAAYNNGTGYPNNSGQKGCIDGH